MHALGDDRARGKTEENADRIRREAKLLQDAGAAVLMLECVPSPLGKQITEDLSILSIDGGGGPDCSARIPILHNMLDIYPANRPGP